jgi:uncharacterized protein YecE (DUF72 family)
VPNRACVNETIRIGTSGWEYGHWRGSFYPADLRRERWFEFYAERFDTVELNATFYRLPERRVFEGWAERAPAGFRYAVKASRYLTHVKRLRDPAEPLERLWSRATALGRHLGPMLYQLPPRWRPDRERLAGFLQALPPDRAQALEIRDPRWYRPQLTELLAERGVALCVHDMQGSAAPASAARGPIVYLRFHGAGQRYAGAYRPQVLGVWARRIVDWSAAGWPVWAYFNNDIGGHAVVDAERLREFVGRRL